MKILSIYLPLILIVCVSGLNAEGSVLPRELIRETGLIRLASMNTDDVSIEHWIEWLSMYEFGEANSHDDFGWLTCILALEAVNTGNFGIGCILTDGNGDVIVLGHNEVFNPYFRSDRHGEMVVMDDFEANYPDETSLEGFTLFSSLESCPMCNARLITSGVDSVFYLAPDSTGGMVHLMANLPPVWIELASRQTWGIADCTEELISAADSIFFLNVESRNALLMER